MPVRTVIVPGVPRLPSFSHAAIDGRTVHVSGMIGAVGDPMQLIDGGVAAETTQALANIAVILDACGCTLQDVAKVNVYLTRMDRAAEMNAAYIACFGDHLPARITVGCTELALGALVELDCVAIRPHDEVEAT